MSLGARLTKLTRLGFAARGLLYIVIAYLVLVTGREEDVSGALAVVAEGTGRWLLVLMAAGFFAYGVWRLIDAATNLERHDHGKRGFGERLGAAASGAAHLFLAWQAIRLIGHAGASTAIGIGADEGARTALDLPGGALMLIAAGAVLIGVGFAQLVNAGTCRFCDDLDPQVAHKPWVRWAGRLGYAARGVVFIISGVFILQAGLQTRAGEAGGMEEALTWLSEPWDMVVAAGLLMFGLFSLIEARFRRLHDVPVDRAANKVRATLDAH